uniref:Guanine nucleotide-binding protein subunit gamma n=1 Tax=Periophthalmus magnuspinnatus TaxID=409849 RepID=A0A3B4BES4_9GOBI
MTFLYNNSVVQAQKLIHQLRIEISLTAVDLVQYCQEHKRCDPLLTGINSSMNPFKDKKSCAFFVLLFPPQQNDRMNIPKKPHMGVYK